MPTPVEVLRVADLIKLAADTARECCEMQQTSYTAQVVELALRIKGAAEELEHIGLEMRRAGEGLQ